jgi:hypothetical protein
MDMLVFSDLENQIMQQAEQKVNLQMLQGGFPLAFNA